MHKSTHHKITQFDGENYMEENNSKQTQTSAKTLLKVKKIIMKEGFVQRTKQPRPKPCTIGIDNRTLVVDPQPGINLVNFDILVNLFIYFDIRPLPFGKIGHH